MRQTDRAAEYFVIDFSIDFICLNSGSLAFQRRIQLLWSCAQRAQHVLKNLLLTHDRMR